MHIAATNPLSISEEDIDQKVVENEKEIYRQQALNEGKKPDFVDKIVEGRVKKFYQETASSIRYMCAMKRKRSPSRIC